MTREEAIKLIDTHTVCFYNEIDSPTLQALHMAIEALSAESETLSHEEAWKQIEGDLISRADAIEAVMKHHDGELNQINYGLTLAKNELQALPSADAVQGWIPCSERLPEKTGWYVVTVVGFETITDMLTFYKEVSAWSDVTDEQKVVAWMPLPTPYKGGDTE